MITLRNDAQVGIRALAVYYIAYRIVTAVAPDPGSVAYFSEFFTDARSPDLDNG